MREVRKAIWAIASIACREHGLKRRRPEPNGRLIRFEELLQVHAKTEDAAIQSLRSWREDGGRSPTTWLWEPCTYAARREARRIAAERRNTITTPDPQADAWKPGHGRFSHQSFLGYAACESALAQQLAATRFLPDRLRLVLQERRAGITYKQIADELDISITRVAQLEEEAQTEVLRLIDRGEVIVTDEDMRAVKGSRLGSGQPVANQRASRPALVIPRELRDVCGPLQDVFEPGSIEITRDTDGRRIHDLRTRMTSLPLTTPEAVGRYVKLLVEVERRRPNPRFTYDAPSDD
jgi:DNA-directed RNA polymerase specialized sigma24 family protein